MYELTPLFIYKFQFMAELLFAEGLISFRMKRKPLFLLRLFLSVAACFGFAYAVPIAAYNAAYCSFLFILLFSFTVCMMEVCFDERWVTVVFCAVAGYTVQHVAYVAFDFIVLLTGVNMGMPLGTYGSTGDSTATSSASAYAAGGSVFTSGNFFLIVMWVFVYFEVYCLSYAFTSHRISKTQSLELKNMALFFVVILIVLVDIVASSFVTYYSADNFEFGYVIMLYLYNIFCCILALYIQFELALRRKLETDFQTVNTLWKQKSEQYRLTKENIALINQKCHDLKHQIHTIGDRASIGSETLGEIESVVSIYDSVVKTGNDALDVILTEKSLLCNSRGIKLACIVDGNCLEFMSEVDLYALFGNLVDNALEAVINLDDERRFISLTVKSVQSFVSVNVHNCYDGTLEFENSLPKTTKSDGANHGYGMKSVQMICRKYSGELKISAKDGVFNLNMIFPDDGGG